MANMPRVAPRDLTGLMNSVIGTHQRIRDTIREHAEAQARLRTDRNADLNAHYGMTGEVKGNF